MKPKHSIVLIFLLTLIVAATACGKRDAEPGPQKPNDTPAIVEETPYRLYDEEGADFVYLSEDHPEVAAVKTLVEEFVTAMNTMDYRSVIVDKAHPYLTQSLLELTVEEKTWETMFDNLKEVEVVSEAKDVVIETAMFDYDWETVYILYTSTLNILSANEEKLQQAGMTVGENFERAGLQFSKENGQWKVAGFGKLD